jgi:hypothetical protein
MKETIIALIKIVSWNFPGGLRQKEDKFNENSWFPGRYSNIISPE